MYEHHKEPLLTRAAFLVRLTIHAAIFIALIGAALSIGALGYHLFEGIPWIDAILNASMILGGMGPVTELQTTGGKLFASGYALFSGLMFVFSMSVLLAPIVHRLLHQFHLQQSAGDSADES